MHNKTADKREPRVSLRREGRRGSKRIANTNKTCIVAYTAKYSTEKPIPSMFPVVEGVYTVKESKELS
jgi:hypothetical protein